MKIKIDIECDTVAEVKSHLSCLVRQIKKHQKYFNIPENDELAKGTHITDNNCYGTHDLSVIEGRGEVESKWHKKAGQQIRLR